MMTTSHFSITQIVKAITMPLTVLLMTLFVVSCNDDDDPDPCEGFEVAATRSADNDINITISAGTAPYNYTIAYTGEGETVTGTTSDQTISEAATVFSAATITITDANNCEATESVEVFDPCVAYEFEVERNIAGELAFTITEGTAPYAYSIAYEENDTPQTGTSEEATFTIAGTDDSAATITLTDANDCEATFDLAASLCKDFALALTHNASEIAFEITAGTAPYTYTIDYADDTEDQTGSSDEQEFSVAVDSYAAATISVTDANGCAVAEQELAASACNELEATIIGSDSQFYFNITGGEAPYSYVITFDNEPTPQEGTNDEAKFSIVADMNIDCSIELTDNRGCVHTYAVTGSDLSTLYDSRDGERYQIVNINGQVWLAENFKYQPEGSLCYDNDQDNCDELGPLYNWETANADGFAPQGWSLPTQADINDLKSFVGDDDAGPKLRVGGITGFDAVMSGGSANGSDFVNLTSFSMWSQTSIDDNNAYGAYIDINPAFLGAESYPKGYYFSVRLIKSQD